MFHVYENFLKAKLIARDGNNISVVCSGEPGRNIWGDGRTHGHIGQ